MRAMPSPTWRTVPTSARSGSTSYCSIRSLRIEVISSGRSFTATPCVVVEGGGDGGSSGDELPLQALQAAADAGVEAQRAGLDDEAADQAGVALPRRVDGEPGRRLDLAHDLRRLLLVELVGGRQLDLEAMACAGDQALELARDLLEFAGSSLVDEEEEEVAHELVPLADQVLEDRFLRSRIELRVAQYARELRNGGDRGDEVAEVAGDRRDLILVARRLEQRLRV